jgi:hypothetical protein
VYGRVADICGRRVDLRTTHAAGGRDVEIREVGHLAGPSGSIRNPET